MWTMTKAVAVATMALGLVLSGCTDDAAVRVTNNGTGNNLAVNNGGGTQVRTGRLMHVTPCDPNQTSCTVPLTFAAQADLNVKFIDGNGNPVVNRGVSFSTVDPVEAAGTVLRARNAVTNSQGVATVSINAGNTPGTAQVVVSVANEPAITPIRFTVAINSKDSAYYEVAFDRTGNAPISHVDVYLYRPNVTCEALAEDLARERDNNPATFPQLTAEFTRRGLVNADGTIPNVIFPDVRNGEAYTVAAKGYSLTNDEVEVTYGCKANNPAVANGLPVTVRVGLLDHFPLVTGTYNVVHSFDLRQGLPPSVRTVVDMIGRVVTDPGSFVVGCPPNPPDPSVCPPGSEGIIQILADFLPDGDLKNSILSFLNSNIANAVIRDLVNELFFTYFNTNAPDWLRTTRTITEDIYNTLKQFRVEGKMFFNEAPVARADQNGNLIYLLPDNSGRQLWNTLIFYWSRGCEGQPQSCRVYRIASNQLGTNASPIEGLFSGALLAHDKLEIFPHTLTFNYGTIILAVIERIALPEIFGPQINSIETLLTRFINCQTLSEQASSSTNVQTIVRNLCTNLLSQAAGSLRDYVNQNLVLQGNDHFRISTPDGQPCTIHQPANYVGNWPNKPLPYIEGMGKSEPVEMQCKWDVRLRFSQESQPTQMLGTFHGTRDGF